MFANEGQFANIVIRKEQDKQNLNYILEEDERDKSHM